MSEATKPARKRPAVSRRAFLRTALGVGTAGAFASWGAASLGFVWPELGEGFGATMNLGAAGDLLDQITDRRAPYVFPPGRMYVITWNPSVPGAEQAYGEDHSALDPTHGLMALYHTCPHLGCRVPWCQSSQWFECPCHGSKYNRWGEWTGGPAPRGLDRFPSTVDDDGDLLVNTGALITGPSRTARVLAQEPEGPACIDL